MLFPAMAPGKWPQIAEQNQTFTSVPSAQHLAVRGIVRNSQLSGKCCRNTH